MLIGITGFARHGKDSVADVLVKHYKFTKDSLASPMKEACSIIFGWSLSYIEKHKDEIDPEWGISPRQVLVLLGTEFGQKMLCDKYPSFNAITGKSLWVNRLLNKYTTQDNLVISDVRFVHEEAAIRKRKGIIIEVHRPGYAVCLDHESERQVLLVKKDYRVVNRGSLHDLEKNVLYLCSHDIGLRRPSVL